MQYTNIFSKFSFNQLRLISRSSLYQTVETSATLEKLTIPLSSNVDKPVSPRIDKLVNEISQLNLIEVSELSTLLKQRLNLPDTTAMPIGNFAVPGIQQAEEEETTPQKVKTVFTVKLTKFEEKQKVALIKEIKNLLEGMNLVQAKKFVESAPAIVKADVSKDEAEKLKEALTKVGGTVDIE